MSYFSMHGYNYSHSKNRLLSRTPWRRNATSVTTAFAVFTWKSVAIELHALPRSEHFLFHGCTTNLPTHSRHITTIRCHPTAHNSAVEHPSTWLCCTLTPLLNATLLNPYCAIVCQPMLQRINPTTDRKTTCNTTTKQCYSCLTTTFV